MQDNTTILANAFLEASTDFQQRVPDPSQRSVAQVAQFLFKPMNKKYLNEFMNIFVKFDNVETPPSTIAHEMLHCFGAPDLYYANELIPQEFVDYCASSGTRDIMYTVALGDEITDWFTGLDAYYVGLNPYSMQVDEWNLGPSQHFPE